MTTDNEKGPLNQMESGQEKRSASEARALSEIVNGTPSENLCRRGSPAPEQASETTAQQPRTYTTQPAESVMGIALRQCGNEMEWRHILACNPEFARMLPHEYFPVGTVLNLPPHPAAASRFEKPEKSLAPEGRSEARGRWIQANCPTGDIIESPSPSNNREFPTSISENDCEHRIALAPSQPAAAPIDERPCIVRDDCKWPACRLDCIIDSRNQKAREGKSLAELTAPSPADARVGLTDEQREAIQRAIDYADMSDRDSDAEALRALLAIPLPEPRAEVTDWQPIETAPKDGTLVLLVATRHSMLYPNPEMIVGAYRRGWWSGPAVLSHVTHWMPLPAAPFDAARAGEAS